MMAIGSSFPPFSGKTWGILALLAFGCVLLPLRAQDQIRMKAGTTVSGQITGVSGQQVVINTRQPNGSVGRLLFYISDIQSVIMPPPATVTKLKGAPPATVASTLAPLVQQYAGLPADWVVDAMGQLADAYDAQGQPDKSAAVYKQINQLYPGSPYQKEAIVGQAKIDLKAGKPDVALAAVKPLVDQANQNIAPSAAEGRLFAGAFLIYGQVLEDQKQFPQALEAYLTVKTMFYQNPALVDQADQFAKALMAHHPDVGVD